MAEKANMSGKTIRRNTSQVAFLPHKVLFPLPKHLIFKKIFTFANYYIV